MPPTRRLRAASNAVKSGLVSVIAFVCMVPGARIWLNGAMDPAWRPLLPSKDRACGPAAAVTSA